MKGRYSMESIQLTKDLYWTGVIDKDLRVFDILLKTEYGTTYNSYVLKGSEKTALFETAKAGFKDEFFKRLESVVAIKDIDYLIVDHTEPDHSGSIERLVAVNPDIVVVGTITALTFLKKIVNHDFKSMAVKDGDTLSLGNKTLEFMLLPNLHWPDTMFTYIKEDAILMTCDVFGSHYSDPVMLRSKIKNEPAYLEAVKYYFDHIMGPFINPYMINALAKIDGLPIKMIGTGHGPIIDSKIEQAITNYQAWCQQPEKRDNKLVVIPYVSAYGYTRSLAEVIGKAIIATKGIDVEYYDMVECDQNAVLARMLVADGILFGTPTMVGDALKPIWDLTTSISSVNYKGKLMSAFGSYGWSGEGVPHIIERLKQLKGNVIDGYRVRFKPTDEEFTAALEFGKKFADCLKDK